MPSFPSSSGDVLASVAHPKAMNLTPQESEQLSMYVSNDDYVKQQKADIEELSQMFQGLMGEPAPSKGTYMHALKSHFHPAKDTSASYCIDMTDKGNTLIIEVDGESLNCYYGDKDDANVMIKAATSVLDRIISGESTLQGAFMTGDLTAKGDFKYLRIFDSLFRFKANA